MMNALKDMQSNPETFCRMVLALSDEAQSGFWAAMGDVLEEDEVRNLQQLVGLYRLHTDTRYRSAMQEACRALYTASVH